VPCCERNDLFAPILQECISRDNECADAIPDDRREGGIDLAWSGGIEDKNLQPKAACGLLQLGRPARRFGIIRVEKQGDSLGIGDQIVQQRQPLRPKFGVEPSHTALPGTPRAVTSSGLTRAGSTAGTRVCQRSTLTCATAARRWLTSAPVRLPPGRLSPTGGGIH
jgi:hypothetical protein